MNENGQRYLSQIVLARTEIKNLRQQISSLKHELMKEVKLIKSKLDGMRCVSCGDRATTITNSTTINDVPSSSSQTNSVSFRPIGIIETSFQSKRGVPRQPTVMANARGTLVIDMTVFNNPEHALMGLEEFSHLWIIFHFHATESNNVPAKVAPPRLGGERRGVFSTRSPHRPCPIGLSLVKIQSIEGNNIHFLGVDMVNGTPVLDIKPYIPQYDYPGSGVMSSRPPTEGISDVIDDIAALNVGDDVFDGRSLSPRLTQPIGIDTSSPHPRSPYGDVPSPDLQNINSTPPSPDSPTSEELLEPRRRPDERGAPDGQERFTPPQAATLINNPDEIRIASWISNPPSQTFEVTFTSDALAHLTELIGDRAQSFKTNIEGLLSEDPRSQYVRARYPNHEYSCVLEDLSISCVFDSATSTCTIIAVRNAEEMQQS